MTYPTLEMLIDGKLVHGGGRTEQDALNPATEKSIGRLPHATREDLDAALESSQRGFLLWSKMTAIERGRIIKRAADLVRERIDHIAAVLTLEQGKPLAEARGEVAVSANILEWCAEEGRRAYGRIIPSPVSGVRMMSELEPIGPALAFTPWNFPALTPARKMGGAMAAGCSIILKAAEDTPGTALELTRAFVDAGLPAGVLNLVFGDPAIVSEHLIASPISRKVSFTGSVPVGRHLMILSAQHMKRTTMELGGHAPVVVFDDVDVESVAALAASNKFRNAGQVCISPTRFYVQESVHDRFVEAFAEHARALHVGDGMDPATKMGPLANSRRVEAMETMISDALQRGAKLRTGGARRGNQGYFFEPTILSDVSDDALLMREEPFGPVAPVVRFRTMDDVVERANSLPFGLASYAFSASNQRALEIGRRLKAGMVGLNTFAVSHPETPFGGVKHSGHGQEGGIEGLQGYYDVKLTAHA